MCAKFKFSSIEELFKSGNQTRIKMHLAQYGGKKCHGKNIKPCNSKPCPSIDCKYTDWTPCSATCGQGTKTRGIKKRHQNGGVCLGPYTKSCYQGLCPGTRFKQTIFHEFHKLSSDLFHCIMEYMMCCMNKNMNCNKNYSFCNHKALDNFHENKKEPKSSFTILGTFKVL